MLKQIWRIFCRMMKDERGFVVTGTMAALLGLGAMGGAGIAGGILGKKDEKDQPSPEQFQYPNTPELQTALSEGILGKLSTGATPYTQNQAFNINKPAVEGAAESTILGKLQNPVTAQTFTSDITDKYYAAQKARQEESFEDERRKTLDRYNRLGLSTSTPGLNALGEIDKSQRLYENELSTGLMYEDIQREIDATRMAEEIMGQFLGQAQLMGQTQRGGEEFGVTASMQDIQRQTQEEQRYNQLGLSYLGQGAASPESTYGAAKSQYEEPNIWEQLGTTGTDIGSLILLSQILGV